MTLEKTKHLTGELFSVQKEKISIWLIHKLKLKAIDKLRIFHLINHMSVICFIYIDGISILILYSLLVWNIIGCFGMSIGYHRLLAHKSFQTYKWFERFCVLTGCLATGGSPISWAGIHRKHHHNIDTNNDPHSPKMIGGFKVHFHLWSVGNIQKKYVQDLLKDKFLIYVHKNYYKILIIWICFLLLIDTRFFIYTYCIPSVFSFHSFGFINYLAHKFGYRNFDNNDSSKNNWFANLWTAGEGWHNNHHKLPTSYRIGFRWFEWDMSAFLLEKLSLIKHSTVPHPRLAFSNLYKKEIKS